MSKKPKVRECRKRNKRTAEVRNSKTGRWTQQLVLDVVSTKAEEGYQV